MKGWIALVLCVLAPAAYADDVKPSGVLDFDVVTRDHDFVVRDDTYEMTFANQPQLIAQEAPLGPGHTANGALLIDSSDPDVDVGNGVVMVTILPVPSDVAFDGARGAKGTADGMLSNLGTVATHSDRAFTFGGLKGREYRASGTRDATPWRMRMVVAWDAKHRVLISIAAVFGPAAPDDAPAHLDAFIKAFKTKAGAAPHAR